MTAFSPPSLRRPRAPVAALLAAVLAVTSAPSTSARAQDGWTPFPEPEQRRPARARDQAPPEDGRPPPLAPMNGQLGRPDGPRGPAATGRDAMIREPLPPLDERSRAVDRGELAPVMAGDGSGLPYELWRGLDAEKVEALFASLDIPPRSPALAALWRRLVTAEIGLGGAGDGSAQLTALRVEALTRSGLIKEAGEAVARLPGGPADALAAVLTARSEIALGRRETACEAIRSGATASIPSALKGDAILISGYCAVSGGNAAAAALTADLAREHGSETGAGLVALDALASGGRPDLTAVKRISPLDYRLIVLAGGADPGLVVEKATPAALAAITLDASADSDLRLAAGEAALRLNAIAPGELAALYRSRPAAEAQDAPSASAPASRAPGPQRRADLYNAASAERTPLKKVRLIRAFLDDARRAGLYLPALEMMGGASETLAPVAEIGWFAETAIEIALAAGQYDRARAWIRFAASVDRAQLDGEPGPLDHWLALADIAEPRAAGGRRASHSSAETLASVETLALRGKFASDLLHRLATVLDALDTNVPIPLWEAASRTPQPAGGHLPETGVLSELLDASRKKELGRTVLVAMKALGPMGAEGAHMIALGDSIRALKRAGLESDARRLGFEALFASWPRAAAH